MTQLNYVFMQINNVLAQLYYVFMQINNVFAQKLNLLNKFIHYGTKINKYWVSIDSKNSNIRDSIQKIYQFDLNQSIFEKEQDMPIKSWKYYLLLLNKFIS